jgi:hypothetical protein
MHPEKTVARILSISFTAIMALVLTACGGGGGGGGTPPNNEQSVNGGGVKGPLANADVAFYEFDANFSNFQAATAAASGTTNNQAKFVGITLGSGSTAPNPPYIVVFSARDADPTTGDVGTTDLTTGQPPVIKTLKTVVTQAMLDSGANIYATPLTTMAVDVAIANALSGVAPYTGPAFGSTATVDKFLAALPIAASQVRESVGFGLPATVDIFDTPPLVDDAVTDTNVAAVAEYRQAVEALSAVVYEMSKQTSSASPDAVLSELTNDLADGAIDGQTKSGSSGTTGTADSDILSEASLDILNVDPATLNIPGTSTPVTDVETVLNTETTSTGTTTTVDATTADAGSTTVAVIDTDRDDDGVLNSDDAFPDDPNETTDTDGDGIGDNADPDIDGDGVLNDDDFAPTDSSVWVDPAVTAGGSDADGDGVDDASDNCPASYNPAQADMDSDGEGDACDTDIDGDTVLNAADAFPLNASESVDTDHDGVGNNSDPDDDNDGVLDTDEAGQGTDPLLADTDGDGRNDKKDKCPTDPAEWLDSDGDGICNGNDSDADNDGVANASDDFPNDPRADTDTDGDGVADDVYAWDGSSRGAVNAALSDPDDDNDGLPDTVESNSGTFVDSSDTGTDPKNADSDGDGLKDNVETGTGTYVGPLNTGTNPNMADSDGDGINDKAENNSGTFVDSTHTGTDPNAADTDGDGLNDGVETNTASFVDASDTGTNPLVADTDGDGLNDGGEVSANTDPFVTDTDGDGLTDGEEAGAGGTGTDPTLADSDSDGINDGTEVTAGTNPLSNDTDGDTVLDDVDNCPTVANLDQADGDSNGIGDACDVDTDSDGVSDAIDNCPTMANADQANLDGDSMGDVCDNDRDGDGVDNASDAFPDDASETADSDGDGVGDNADVCPMDATDSCPTASLDMSGVQRLSATAQTVTELAGVGSCGDEMVGDTASFYVTTAQTGTTGTASVAMHTVWGDNLTGTVDTATGVYTLNGVTTFNAPYSSDYDTDTISVSGNALDGTGSISVTEAFNGVDQCAKTYNYTAANVYKHVAGEDYNGVYGLEFDNDNDGRDSFAIQLEVSGSTITPYLPDNTDTVSNATFNSATGFFSFDLDGTEDNGDGTSSSWHDQVTGIFVRAPGEATLPAVALAVSGNWADWDAPGGSSGGGSMTDSGSDDSNGYGKRVSSSGFTRNSHYRKSADGKEYDAVVIGMSHPPLKLATATSQLYVEVLDSDGVTRLCTGLYSKRYTNAHYEPAADYATEQFQPQWYSFVSCNTSTNMGGVSTHNVADGDSVTVRIMDTGADGVVDGGDDTAVAGASMTYNVELNSAAFTELPSANTFALNGAAASKTMKQGTQDGVIELFGFFDVNEDMDFSWTGLAGMGATDKYSLQVKQATGDYEQVRFSETSPVGGTATESITIAAGTLDMWDGNVIRVRARQDGSDSAHRVLSTSKWVQIQPGIRGLFNVELGGALGIFLDTFQLFLDGDMGNGTTGNVNDCQVTNNPAWTCNYGSIDYTTNTVSLNMTDNTATYGTVTLALTFSDGANGSVDSVDVTLTPAQTHVRLVNPELGVRTLQPSNGVAQQTLVTVANLIAAGDTGSGGVFDKAVFKRNDNADFVIGGSTVTGVSAKPFWSEASAGGGLPFSGEVSTFRVYPTDDGIAQRVGQYIFNRTGADWGLGAGTLAATKYKAVWTTSTDPNLKFVFKTNYTAPDASALVTPLLGQVTVDLPSPVTGSQGTANGGDMNNPIVVTADPSFPLTWTGSTVAGGEWQIRVIMVSSTTSGIPAGTEIRTAWMTDGVDGLVDNTDGTWSWTNQTGVSLVSGDVVKVQIRTRDANNTMLGAQRLNGIVGNEDVVYLTVP